MTENELYWLATTGRKINMATKKSAYEAATPALDKKKALQTALSQIEKSFGKGAVMRLGDRPEMTVDAVPTGSLALDAALGIGGVPKGRIIEIYGPESSGKTTLALHILAEVQKMGGQVAFVDAEHALDPVYAAARHWRSRTHWFGPVQWMLWLWTLLLHWFPSRSWKVRWVTASWAFRRV